MLNQISNGDYESICFPKLREYPIINCELLILDGGPARSISLPLVAS